MASPNINLQSEATKILEQIFRDYQKKAEQFEANPGGRHVSTLPWDSVMRTRTDQICARDGAVTETSLIFAAILAISETYMEQLRFCPDILWPELVRMLVDNKSSIEFFARSRGVTWLSTVRDFISTIYLQTPYPPAARRLCSDQALGTFPDPNGISDQRLHQHYPDTHYLSQTGMIVPMQAPTYNSLQRSGRQVVDINECIYRPDIFESTTKPQGWPWVRWPQHPQQLKVRAAGGIMRRIRCQVCDNRFSEEADWDYPTVGCQCHGWCEKSLVQVVQYPAFPSAPSVVNRGVRALQVFKANTIIGEYTGEFIPLEDTKGTVHQDDVYLFSFTSLADEEMGAISARRFGNWTRYINHSDVVAAQNVGFKQVQIMNKSRMVVTTSRRIEFGEEILGHYGSTYFNGK